MGDNVFVWHLLIFGYFQYPTRVPAFKCKYLSGNPVPHFWILAIIGFGISNPSKHVDSTFPSTLRIAAATEGLIVNN